MDRRPHRWLATFGVGLALVLVACVLGVGLIWHALTAFLEAIGF